MAARRDVTAAADRPASLYTGAAGTAPVPPRHHWRLTLRPDPQDAREKALRHHRFNVWYGPHFLRFTKEQAEDGAAVLRLEERARMAGADAGGGHPLLVGDALPSRFVHEETFPPPAAARVNARVDEAASRLLELGMRFFDEAARLLDAGDAATGR